MTRNQTKLISAGLTLLLSILMLAGASFAWFTISTAPEITGMQVTLYTDLDLLVSKTETGEYTQSVSTSQQDVPTDNATIDDLQFYAPLRPVSTVDGKKWYRATYDDDEDGEATGALNPVEEFELLDEATYANVVLWEKNGSGEYTVPMDQDSAEYILRERQGYFMYADVWLKTENQDGVNVTISVPDIQNGQSHNNGKMQNWEIGLETSDFSTAHGSKYGSFALAKYNAAGPIDNFAQTALRVGFLTEDGKFTVWEPNADQRSVSTFKPKEAPEGQKEEPAYIVGYDLKADLSNFKDKHYIPTHPIGTAEDGTPTVVDMPWDRLLIQRTSQWDEEKAKANYKNPTSADVRHFGTFVTDNTKLSKTALTNMDALDKNVDLGLASKNIILTLRKDVPQKVRIYFWLEGQDVDCWNDIASGSFLVNLEFAAQPEKPVPPGNL